MKAIFIVTFMLTSLNLWAIGPIKRHLSDASKINQQRKSLYEALTDGKSARLSNELILMEKLAFLITGHLDLAAKEYLDQGVMLFEHDLVDMKYTPSFKEKFADDLIPSERINLDIKKLRKHWLKLIRNDELDTLYRELDEMLDQKELKATNQNCLTRHFVESIARFIKNIEAHQINAANNNLSDPKPLLVSFIKIQIHSLGWAYSLDKRAYKLQNQYGVPLFCQDVPVIDFH